MGEVQKKEFHIGRMKRSTLVEFRNSFRETNRQYGTINGPANEPQQKKHQRIGSYQLIFHQVN